MTKFQSLLAFFKQAGKKEGSWGGIPLFLCEIKKRPAPPPAALCVLYAFSKAKKKKAPDGAFLFF